MKTRLVIIILTAIAIPASFVDAPYPEELILQHIPTLVAVALIAFAVVRLSPTTLSFTCAIGFLWLHLIGARWIYSFVPYDAASESLLGVSISEIFGWQRNHYDRLVHFASGVLGVPMFSEWLQRSCGLKPLAAALLAISCVLAVGAIYEVIEWQIAITFSPQMAESYNGQQGDVWDPQKDLALAGLGAMISAAFCYRWSALPARRAAN
ncbi:DUF2238 domain-containing protein [Stieleria varia]|uniref:Inner membrane protein YjdF n=1 Tax=Stieleria varia TaxID=2528005 RepID=A0A5C6B880_9BACT|nr:DUF2238 domain-containing protein [Stieleria varia]TWU08475.1 Inner membrane protein YjdF [Stieleria varia]